jgi:hypothetical protein
MPIDIGALSIACAYGQIGKILDFGINDVSQNVSQNIC